MIPTMRTGLIGEVTQNMDHMNTVAALMRVFMREAITISGRYTIACGRQTVTATDVRKLMYCARTFLNGRDGVRR